jgi:hypothetical protein
VLQDPLADREITPPEIGFNWAMKTKSRSPCVPRLPDSPAARAFGGAPPARSSAGRSTAALTPRGSDSAGPLRGKARTETGERSWIAGGRPRPRAHRTGRVRRTVVRTVSLMNPACGGLPCEHTYVPSSSTPMVTCQIECLWRCGRKMVCSPRRGRVARELAGLRAQTTVISGLGEGDLVAA